MPLPHVYILTWCQRPELLYGSTLVFKTLRTGFPNSPVYVADGASIPTARQAIRHAAESCDAKFFQLDRRTELYDFIRRAIELQKTGQAVFVDPDVCFWEPIENWQFDGLAAGRHIPRHRCDFTGCLTEPRLHTSLLWFPDLERLQAAIVMGRQARRFFEPFRCVMVPLNGRWHFFDNMAGLYGMFPDEMRPFEERHLDAYDHLFSGSFGDSVFRSLGPDFKPVFAQIHRTAQEDYRKLKGSWRLQEKYFQSRAISGNESTR